ncbi:MAG: hypothetical protein KDE05_11510, partial [Parvularculaceae bacterium]|nr:hypothetical protein [Parvularculaceae bacterium]
MTISTVATAITLGYLAITIFLFVGLIARKFLSRYLHARFSFLRSTNLDDFVDERLNMLAYDASSEPEFEWALRDLFYVSMNDKDSLAEKVDAFGWSPVGAQRRDLINENVLR